MVVHRSGDKCLLSSPKAPLTNSNRNLILRVRASAYELWEDTDMQSRTPLRVHLLLDNRLEQPFLSFFFYTLNQSHSLDSSCNHPHNRQRWHFILKMQPRPSPASSSPLASHCPLGPTPSSSHTRHRLSPFIPGKRATERVFPWSETEAWILWRPGAAQQRDQTHYMERHSCPMSGDIFSPAIRITECTLEPRVFCINHWISEETTFL